MVDLSGLLARIAQKCHLAALGAHQSLLLHLAELPHHGAAVRGDVVREGPQGEGQSEAGAPRLVRELLETAQELFPDAPAGEDIHPLAEGLGLLRDEAEHVLDQEAVVEAGVLAALQDLGVADVDHLAGCPADHLQHILAAAGEGQGLAEDAAGAQLLQHCRDAVLINADEGGRPPLDDTHGVTVRRDAAGGIVVHHLVGPEGPVHGLEAVVHGKVTLVIDVLEEGALLQFLWAQHGSLRLSLGFYPILLCRGRLVKKRTESSRDFHKSFTNPSPALL